MANKDSNILMKYEFPSGDQLILEKSSGMYNTHGYIEYYQVVYGEKNGNTFNAIGVELFPLSEKLKAETTYATRLGSDYPSISIDQGYTLADIFLHNQKYLSRDMAEVHEIWPYPAGSNPFQYDRIRAGMHISNDITILYRHPLKNGGNEPLKSLVIFNRITGRRLLVDMSGFTQTLQERIDQVESNRDVKGRLSTLGDLRDYLNHLSHEELKSPVVIGNTTCEKFVKVSKIIETDMKNPLIIDQPVLVPDKWPSE